jgi:hypothetical protein
MDVEIAWILRPKQGEETIDLYKSQLAKPIVPDSWNVC